MEVIRNRKPASIQVLGDQIEEPGITYAEHGYVIREGDVLLNALTGEVLRITDEEADRAELIRRWVLTPAGVNLAGLSHLIREATIRMRNNRSINSYTIFTTTGCNAACSYCFQNGLDVVTMTPETAADVAAYIKQKANRGREIGLRWFGGEPLVNKDVITLICQDLQDNQRPYTSSMSSNGDLFPDVTDAEIRLWNLKRVQFTIDDIDDEYDQIKNLPAGAYDRLKETVERLASLGINCIIRVHYDPEKGVEPCMQIVEDFKEYPHVTMYARMLYGESRTQADYEALLQIEDRMLEVGRLELRIPDNTSATYCMADNRSNACITPEGNLSACEHYATGQDYGSIYSAEQDKAILAAWAAKTKYRDACTDCSMYPACELLCDCPGVGVCSEGYRYYQEQRIRRALRALS